MADKTTKPTSKKKSPAGDKADEMKHSIPAIDTSDMDLDMGASVLDEYAPDESTTTTKPTKKDRPVVHLDDETQESFVRFVMLKTIADVMDNKKKENTNSVYSKIFEKYTKTLWANKTQPMNPSIMVKNSNGETEASGLFVVMVGSKIKINTISVEKENPKVTLVRALIAQGVSEENSKKIVQEQVFFTPEFSLNFTEMINGKIISGKLNKPTEDEKNCATILFKSIFDSFSDEESRLKMLSKISKEGWSLLKNSINSKVIYQPKLKDGANFLDNVCRYASSYEELCGILKVFIPLYYCKSCAFAPTDPNRIPRLISLSSDMLSTSTK